MMRNSPVPPPEGEPRRELDSRGREALHDDPVCERAERGGHQCLGKTDPD